MISDCTENKAQAVEAALVTHSINRRDIFPDKNGEVDVKTYCGLFFQTNAEVFVAVHEATCPGCKVAWMKYWKHWFEKV